MRLIVQHPLIYTERDFFQFNGGSSESATRRKYAFAYLSARSFPWSMSSTDSDGAIQVLVFTLYTEACTPLGVCSEKSRRCSWPTITSAQTPCSNIGTPNEVRLAKRVYLESADLSTVS